MVKILSNFFYQNSLELFFNIGQKILNLFLQIITLGFYLLMQETFLENLNWIDQKMKETTDF